MSAGEALRPVAVLAGWAVRENLRRKVFVIVALLTVGFLALFWLGCHTAFVNISGPGGGPVEGVDQHEFAGATLDGLGMFAILFLGCVLAAFLTLSTVRGDAENGLLQPLVVRPVGRTQVILARWFAAAAVCTVYVTLVYAGVLLVLWGTGRFTPDRLVAPALLLSLAVATLAALCVLGSVVMTSTANGIAVFMCLGSGLFAGLLGQIGDAIHNTGLQHAAHFVSWLLPFEAVYQDALSLITADHQSGVTAFLVKLGPLGGGVGGGPSLIVYAVAYLAVVGAIAAVATARRDL